MTTDEKREHLRRMQEHCLRSAQQAEAVKTRLDRYAEAFALLYLALCEFRAKCEHAFRAGCRYCATREALEAAQKVMNEEDVA